MFEPVEVASPTRSWTTILAFLVNSSFLTMAILLPLIKPDGLPALNFRTVSVPYSAPVSQAPAETRPQTAHTVTAVRDNGFHAPRTIPDSIDMRPEPPATGPTGPLVPTGPNVITGLPPIYASANPRVIATVTPHPPVPKTLVVSHLDEGLLIRRVQPVYPAIAIATHVEGTVVISALIGTNGEIEHLQVVSGPALLARAALEAVSQWRYRPYLLNGSPIEVQTQINVNFNLHR